MILSCVLLTFRKQLRPVMERVGLVPLLTWGLVALAALDAFLAALAFRRFRRSHLVSQ